MKSVPVRKFITIKYINIIGTYIKRKISLQCKISNHIFSARNLNFKNDIA